MSRKGENIYKRKDGRWEARYKKAKDERNRVVYGYLYGKTYYEVREKRIQALQKLEEEKTQPKNNEKLLFYCKKWLRKKEYYVKESTYVKYYGMLEQYIIPEFGNQKIMDITSEKIHKFRDQLLYEKNQSPKTVKDLLVVLKSVLGYARQEIGAAKDVEIFYPRTKASNLQVLSLTEQELFKNYLLKNINPCRLGILLSMCTGLRIGEICALRWEDICMENHTLYVRATIQRIADLNSETGNSSIAKTAKTKVIITQPKSIHSIRTIPLTDFAYDLCEKYREENENTFVLTGTQRFMEPRLMQYHFTKDAQACGLNGVHYHILRHTFATRCVEVGFDIKSLSEILGHSNVKITLERYVHSSLSFKQKNMNKLSQVGW